MILGLFDYSFSFFEMLLAVILVAFFCIISLGFHELSRGFIAYKQGDLTPKMSGRLSINPISHIDPWGFVMCLILGIGWTKPIPINPTNFKKFRSGIAKVSLAGILSNLILCVIASFLFVLSLNLLGDSRDVIVVALNYFMVINAFLFIFNMLPIFPLDGFTFISSFMKSDNRFIQFNYKYSSRILIWALILDILIELFSGVSFISYILGTLASWIYLPLCKLWQLLF